MVLQCEHDVARHSRLYHDVLAVIATNPVADFPDRYEPRARNRHRKNFEYQKTARPDLFN